MSGGDASRAEFASALIRWQRTHGRHELPWQDTQDPYRVWLSEIMLQQTQVATVVDYYARFLQRFPDVISLSNAQQDEVLALWSGLGYYSRARNLLRCAQMIASEYNGRFPRTASELAQLPGIGPSTAAAIAAFCFGERISIADGNVRRVLSRLLAFDGDLAQVAAQRHLWDLAQSLLPATPSEQDMVSYTQGLMDLGSGVCTPRRPNCGACPVESLCKARAEGLVDKLPVKSRRLLRRHETWWLVLLISGSGDTVWLERRPSRGIWAGLFCVPVFAGEDLALECAHRMSQEVTALPAVSHALTHRELRLHPLLVQANAGDELAARPEGQWVPLNRLQDFGLPAPVRSLLAALPEMQRLQS